MTTLLLLALCSLISAATALDMEFPETDSLPVETNRTGRYQRLSNRLTRVGTSVSSCITNAGLEGTCMTRFNCLKTGGTLSGYCSTYGVCCETNLQCTDKSTLKRTIIQTPANLSTRCMYIIEPYSAKVCQLRIDMNEFRLQQPQQLPNNNGVTCVDYLLINGMKICGNNDGQHIYVPFDVAGGTESNVNLEFVLPTLNSVKRWHLVVTQLECPTVTQRKSFLPFARNAGFQDFKSIFMAQNTDLTTLAPVGCTQYFTERSGTFESFNYNAGVGPYPPDLNYAICFERRIGDSAIEFTFTDLVMPNDLVNGGLDADCYPNVVTPGKDVDYLMIPSALIKGTATQPTYFCGTMMKGLTVTYGAPGPFVIYFSSDDILSVNNGGFRMTYTII